MHTPPPETYALSLHDALPIYGRGRPYGHETLRITNAECPAKKRQSGGRAAGALQGVCRKFRSEQSRDPLNQNKDSSRDRKSTRLNSSHRTISYAVFCLKKKKI